MPDDINDLRRDRAAAATAMQAAADNLAALEAAETPPDEAALTAAQQAFEDAQAAYARHNARVERQEACDAATATAATSEADPATGGAGGGSGSGGRRASAQPRDAAMTGADFGLMVGALANHRGDLEAARDALEDAGHSGISAIMEGGTNSAGGFLVPRPTAETVIELLRPRVVMRNAGCRMVPMPAGEIRHARQNAAATASYGEENAAGIESEPTFDNVDQSFKTLRALVPVGNALLRHATPVAGAMIRDDVMDVMVRREDLGFIRDQGTTNTPYSVNWWINQAGNWTAAVGNTAAAVEAALRALKSKVEDADVGMVSPGWIMRASTKNFLASLREPDHGSYLFPSIEMNGTLFGFPIHTTSQIPNNLGGGGNETEVYFIDFNDMMIGDSMALTLATSTEAAFVNQAGDTISAFQNDLTLMRAISEHDFAPRHDQAAAGLTGVAWGL